jgi:hypothetical protein
MHIHYNYTCRINTIALMHRPCMKCLRYSICILVAYTADRVADPRHFNADPDLDPTPSFHCNGGSGSKAL